jgi:phosphate transport system permease protein
MQMKSAKYFEEGLFKVLMFISSLVIVAVLGLIIYSIMAKGLRVLSWEMISQTPKGGFYLGREGGILNAIIGSIYLSVGATLLALLISLPIALFMNIYLNRYQYLVHSIRFLLDLLWGVPSIVYGAFGFSIMIYFGFRASLLAGIITVTFFIIPIMVRAMDEVLKSVPIGLYEAALSMGSSKSETAYKVFLRQCYPGVITAVLLAFGRGIGDAASVLFTTGFTDHIPTSLMQPTATLPLAIFFQLGAPIPEVQERAYAAAAVLTFFILLISIMARVTSRKFQRNKINF